MNDIKNVYGFINHADIPGRTDYLFRISLKALVFNDNGEVLLVKESGRDVWDIPGGGIDHGETIKDAISRELKEEVNLIGDFDYQVIFVESPKFVEDISIWQMRIIFAVWPDNTIFSPGEDGDEIRFADIDSLKQSELINEKIFSEHARLAKKIRS
jgi:ADP-ribose pyrophosphatase YjhB (NUDIX family)